MASTYPFSTVWTGAGDGSSWSDPANWNNGVPLTGVDAPDAASDVATIDNSVDTAPFTSNVAGQQSAGEVDVNATDPAGGAAVSLTGSLILSINGGGFGVLNLMAGTFEIDGGTLGGGEVFLKGGTLAFGSFSQWGADTLAGAIIDGPLAINNASTVVIQRSNFAIFDGAGGYGTPTTTTISGGATLSVQGSLYLSGEIDIQNGTLSLDGGDLTNWGAPGVLYADGGALAVTKSFSVYGAYTVKGGMTFTGAGTVSVAAQGDLTLGSAALATPTMVNLDGGTIDVTGALSLAHAVLENGSVILEAGSTYTVDPASSLSNVTVTDNRPAGQTNWTGAAGDGNWSNAGNWTNGVPKSGVNYIGPDQSYAVVNDVISGTASTIDLTGNLNAQTISLAATDPSGAPSVSLQGALDLSWNGEGNADGTLNLSSGTFELDGGSLSHATVEINGGRLAFGDSSTGQNTLDNDIVNGTWEAYNSLVVLTGNDVFSQEGGGPTTVTLNGGAQLLVDNGTLSLDGEIDIQDGGDGTLFALNGGNLSGYNGDAATIFMDDGILAIDANTTFYKAVDVYGGSMVFGTVANGGLTLTVDADSTTNIGKTGAAHTVVNLNGGTLDVFGTLNLTNVLIENGTIAVEDGATVNQDLTVTLTDVTVSGAISTGGSGTIDNTGKIIDAGVTPLTLSAGETIVGGTIIDPGADVTFAGGTLRGVTYRGDLDFDQDNASVVIKGGLTAADYFGNSPGTVNVNGYQASLTFGDTQTFDNATINLNDDTDGIFEAVSDAEFVAAGQVATPIAVTLGTSAVINSNGYNEILGNPQGYDASHGATTLINNGVINVNSGSLEIDPTTFVNNGTIVVENGATLDLEGNWSNPGTISVASGANIELGGSYTTAALATFNKSGNTIQIHGLLDNSGETLNVGAGAAYAHLALLSGGSIKGGTIVDAGDGIAFQGGTLDTVTYDGTINLSQSYVTAQFSNGLKVAGANGSGSGTIDLSAYNDSLVFNDTQTIDNATINLSGENDTVVGVASYSAFQSAGYVPTSQTLTLGNNLSINQTAGYDYLGGLAPYNYALNNLNFGTTTLVNKGVINVSAGTLVINPATFVNKGTINVSSGATLFLDSDWSNLGAISLASGAIIDVGGTFTVAALAQFNQPGVTIEIGGTLDNGGATLSVGPGETFAQLVLEGGGRIKGGTVNDTDGITFAGGTLDGVTYDGAIDLTTQYQSLGVANGSVFHAADGMGVGSITLAAYDQSLNFYGSQTIDNVVINLSGQSDELQVTSDPPPVYGTITTPTNVSFGSNVTLNSNGTEFVFGDTGTGSLTNDGIINDQSGTLNISTTNFVNNGTINVAGSTNLNLGGNWTNNGAIINNGGNLYLGGTFDDADLESITNTGGLLYISGTLNNAGDILSVGQGTALPLIKFNNGTISGGTIADAGSGIALYGGGTLDGVTYDGAFNLSGTGFYTYYNFGGGYYTSPALYINNGLSLKGADGTGPGELNVTSSGIALNFTGTQTFDNAVVSLGTADSINAYSGYPYTAPAALTLGSGLTLNVSGGAYSYNGASFGGTGTITNDGTIDVAAGVFVIDPANFSNAGIINVAAGATLYLEGNWSNTGTITLAAGSSVYLQGSFDAASVSHIVNNGGTIYATTITAPGAANLTQNFSAAIPGISLTDPGAAANQTLTVTLSDANGLLSATGTGISGSGTTRLVLTGSLNQVNAALATLTDIDPVAGIDVITLAAVDSSGNGAASKTVNVYVSSPIFISAPLNQLSSQNVATPLRYMSVSEQGALSDVDLTLTIADTTGILSATGSGVSGSGTNVLTISGSQALINTTLATVTITEANAGTDTVTIGAHDAAGDAAQGVNIAVTTLASPTISAPTTEAVTQDSITALSGFSVSEAGALPYQSFTVTLSDSGGLLFATGSGATGLGATSITVSGSLAQVNADLATLTLDAPNAGTDTLNMTVTDSAGGTSTRSVAITSTHVAAPDLTVSAITSPSAGIAGQTVQLTWTVTNSGDATATGPWTDNVYLASDAAGTNKTLVGSFTYTGTLTPGQTETETQTVTVPSTFAVSAATGSAATYFVVQADAGNQTGALSGIQNHVSVASTPTAVTATIDWATILSQLKPQSIDATDYALFEQRFIAEVGTTGASFVAAINATKAALDATSATPATSADAISLLFRQAAGALSFSTLAQVAVPSANSTGLDALLTPAYYSDVLTRNNRGVFGNGWSSELNDVGPLGPMNGFGSVGRNPASASYLVEYITTYIDQDGNYLGQSVSYQIVGPVGSRLSFLDPSNPYSNYTQANANGTIETFSGTSGLLVGISDGHGNAIAINRNAAGVITSITTQSGNPPKFTVNASGNITSATDSAGDVVIYNYDADGTHLLSTTTSAGTTSYQYSASSNAALQDALIDVTNPDGSTVAYTYSAQGDVASRSINGVAPTTTTITGSNTVTQTNANGQTTVITYDGNGLATSITDAAGNTFSIQRDAGGYPTAITTAVGESYRYAYDSSGHLTSYTDPLGHVVRYAYSSSTANLTAVSDQNGNQTQYQYSAGNISDVLQANGAVTRYQYDSVGNVSEKTEASGATVHYSRNAAGQVTQELFSDGTSQSYTYNASGNLTSSTAADGGVTTYAYNANGLLASLTNAAGQIESYSYNAAGKETQRVEPDGSITNYAYDATGLLAQITDSSGSLIARFSYDAAGTLIRKDTGNGATTLYSYSANSNLTEIKTLALDGSTTSKIDYAYDADGRIVTATSSDGTWTYGYDASNQLGHAVFVSTNVSISNQDLTYHYDAAGNRTQTIFNGATTNYATNNLNQYTSADGTTYSYDANGNLLTKVSGGSTTTYRYNVQNQLISSTDASGTTSYTYDALGNIASQTVGGVKTSYVIDPLALSSAATGPLSAVAQTYDSGGHATATYTYGNGLTAVTSGGTTNYYNADASGNITSLSGANGALTQTYAYTPSGALLSSTGSLANPFQFNGQVGAMTQTNGLVNTRARYYDATTGRFISQDPSGQAGGINLYQYGANNSINYIDADGNSISPSGVIVGTAGIALTGLGAAGLFATAPIAAVVGGLAGLGFGLYNLYQQFTKPGDGIYADTNGEIVTNVVTTLVGIIPGEGVVGAKIAGLQATISGVTVSDLFSLDGAYDYYFGDHTVRNTVTVKRPRATGWGDVHLTTFDGLHYDFQAVGEFVLAKSTVAGDSFQMQIRLAPYGGGDAAPTVTTEIAIQVGDDRVTFGAGRTATVWVDGVGSSLSPTANTLTLAGGTISQLSQGSYQVILKTGEVVDITDSGSYLGYTIDLAPSAKPGSVAGLLGSYTGTGNAFQLPDGTALGSSLTSVQLYQTFGNAWRITDSSSLFDYAAGENTATYTDLAHPSYGLPVSSLPADVIAAATAAVAAAGITDPTAAADAIYDYLITGNPSFITSTAANSAAAPVTATAAVTPSAPPPPSIGISPSAPSVTEVSGQTPVTFTVSLTSAAAADTVVNYTLSPAAIDAGKSYFAASDFGGILPSGTLTILHGQTEAQFTLSVPDGALGSTPDKWLAVSISTPGVDPTYASTAQVDVVNNAPVAGVAAKPVLEYLPGNASGVSQIAPILSQTGNSYSINLGNVVQGTPLTALQFALANLAAAPADGLNAVASSVVGGGFNETGLQSATVIAAGNAYSGITLQPLTSDLGAQSTVVTIAGRDVNSTGYSGSLPNITLTVTENVIAAAQASLSTTAIKLADVRVGSADSQTIAVANTAAAGAAPLDVTLGAAIGATATGSIAQLAAGASDSISLTLGLATTSAGLQTSFVTLNLASDLGSGVTVPLALNQSVGLTGSVYRAATTAITQAVRIVHVGDAASQTLSILNSDPADGYSEGLRATVAGVTGNIQASGTTGLIAAGTSDTSSVSVAYGTSTSGVYSGQINLGLTSDGTGVDTLAPIALTSALVPFSVQVDDYASADLRETSAGGTLSGSAATGYVLDLGTLNRGSAAPTIALSAFNAATGLADLLGGSFTLAGSSAFSNTGFGDFSGLAAGQSDNALHVSLSTINDGQFVETITLNGIGSNASGYTGSVAPVTLTIKGKVVEAAGTIKHFNVAGTFLGVAYASYDNAYTASKFRNLATYYDASGAVVASESFQPNGGYTITLGGSVYQTKTVAADGSYDLLTAKPGTFQGVAYASSDNAYSASKFLGQQTFFDASGAVVASESFQPNGGYTITLGGSVHQTKTVAADGSYDLLTFKPGTFQGVAYASYDNAYTASKFRNVATYYDASGAVVASESFQPNGGYTITLGGSVYQTRTVAADGSYDLLTAKPGTFQGVAYASSDNAYSASKFLGQQTFFDASGAVVASESFQPNGGYTITLGGSVHQTKTVAADGSYDLLTFKPGTFQGVAYASYDNAYTASKFRNVATYYDASGAVVASESFQPNGGYTITLGGSVYQTRTVAADGSYDLLTAKPGTFQGVAYASSDNAYSASKFLGQQTFFDASGAVVASESFQPNGGYTITLGGSVHQTKTVAADGSYDLLTAKPGTFQGVAYASYDNAYTASKFRNLATYYDVSGAVVASESFQPNGGYTITLGGSVYQTKTVAADGSYNVVYENVHGQSYTHAQYAYDHTGTKIALAETLANGTNTTTLYSSGLTLSNVTGVETVSDGVDTFQFGADTHGLIDISRAANTTLAFGFGEGTQTISGFATSGAKADVLSFSTSVFADWAHLLGATKQQGSDLLITLDAQDTLLLKNVSAAHFTSADARFV